MAEKFKFEKEIIGNLNLLIGQYLQEMGLSVDEKRKKELRKEIEDLEKKRTRYLEGFKDVKKEKVGEEIKPPAKRTFVSQNRADFLEARPKEHKPGILAKESVPDDALEYKERFKALKARNKMENKRKADEIQTPSEKPVEEQGIEETIISETEETEKEKQLKSEVINEAMKYLMEEKGLSKENAEAALTPERIQKLVKLAQEKQKI